MKVFKSLSCSILLQMIILSSSICIAQDANTPDKVMKSAIHLYRDGEFEGKSCASYTNEPYWGIVRIKIENGIMSNVLFTIRDSSLHETFSKKYAVHFKDNPVYIQQCRNDSKGVKKYPKKLVSKQVIEEVDAMSGATWSYNIFKASVNEALKSALNEFETTPSNK